MNGLQLLRRATLRRTLLRIKLLPSAAIPISIVCLHYAFTTGHIWEDFFITYRHSVNLVEGNGLVYQVGERVHGFTSAINVLLPALFYFMSGKASYEVVIWCYRLVSILALCFAVSIALRCFIKDNTPKIVLPFFLLFFVFQIKTIAFVTNGQEVAFMIFFLYGAFAALHRGINNNWKIFGLCLSGLMWTRPDGFFYAGVIVLAKHLLSRSFSKEEFYSYIKASLLAFVIYAPWLIGTTLYYGSPIPHSAQAKAALIQNLDRSTADVLWRSLRLYPQTLARVFQPINPSFGGWPAWTYWYGLLCGLITVIYWLIPTKDKLGRTASMAFFFISLYYAYLRSYGTLYSWYLPTGAAIAVIVLSRAVYFSLSWLSKRKQLLHTYILNFILFFPLIIIYFAAVDQMRLQQEIVENGNRKEIGLWLKEHVKASDTVFLEPLGYIGFFSNAHMLDWPGLASPRVHALVKEGKGLKFDLLIKELKPNWLVLRPQELNVISADQWIRGNYSLEKTFDVREKIALKMPISGARYLFHDAVFHILKSKSSKNYGKP